MSKQVRTVAIPDELVMDKIYLIREQKVMLDEDLAELYGVETRRLNEQVGRNIDRFPEDFMFRLNEGRVCQLEVAFCDIKLGRTTNTSICFYRTWCFNAIKCFK